LAFPHSHFRKIPFKFLLPKLTPLVTMSKHFGFVDASNPSYYNSGYSGYTYDNGYRREFSASDHNNEERNYGPTPSDTLTQFAINPETGRATVILDQLVGLTPIKSMHVGLDEKNLFVLIGYGLAKYALHLPFQPFPIPMF